MREPELWRPYSPERCKLAARVPRRELSALTRCRRRLGGECRNDWNGMSFLTILSMNQESVTHFETDMQHVSHM